jgi:uncharacterized membrane protein YoaK (UPF0700 family)
MPRLKSTRLASAPRHNRPFRSAASVGPRTQSAAGMLDRIKLSSIEWILLLTAFAAGSVDVVSFAALGGVFASAMTGNFALLAFYVAHGDAQAATGSVVALSGFVGGCATGVLQRRSRARAQALNWLLTSEAALLLFFALYALWAPPTAHAPSEHLQILLLAVAMGLQAVIGQTISPTTIVFTTTLTKLVQAIADSIYQGSMLGLKEVKIDGAVVLAYLFGALLSGTLIVHRFAAVVVLPLIGVAGALALHRMVNPAAGSSLTRR